LNIEKLHKILVVGLGGKTGVAVSNFLCSHGMNVTASDNKDIDLIKDSIKDLDNSVNVIAPKQDISLLNENFDLIVLSPGVPKSIPLIKEAVKRDIPVVSEIEVAYHFLKGIIIAITGTDGKSTTTSMVYEILKSLDFDVFIGGNIGIPMSSFVDKTSDDSVTVLELSSFQLETIVSFRPDIATILNVAPDHLDRYNGMEDYFETKFGISKNQTKEDFFIYNNEDKMTTKRLNNLLAQKKSFSILNKNADIFFENGKIFFNDKGNVLEVMDSSKFLIPGEHNIENFMTAFLLVKSFYDLKGIDFKYEKFANAAYKFAGLEHRMEKLGVFQKRTFYNDSKATTVGAAIVAVKSLASPVVLILGGRTKGDDYNRLADAIKDGVRHIVLIGESTSEFEKIFAAFNISKADDLDDAILQSIKHGEEGDAIVLSPACASYDMFKNYEERGRGFKNSYEKLVAGEISWT